MTSVAYTLDRTGAFREIWHQSSDVFFQAGCDRGCTAMPAGAMLCHGDQYAEDELHRVPRVCTQALEPGVRPAIATWSEGFLGSIPITAFATTGAIFMGVCPGADPATTCVSQGLADGTRRAAVARLRGAACEIVASPDGTRVAVSASGRGRCDELWIVPSSGSADAREEVVVAFHAPAPASGIVPGQIRSLAWSPDGRRIAVISDHERGCVGGFDIGPCEYQLFVVGADGSGLTRVGPTTEVSTTLQWIP